MKRQSTARAGLLRHGVLLGVMGRACEFGGVYFVGAQVEIDRPKPYGACDLDEYLREAPRKRRPWPRDLFAGDPLGDEAMAQWVRSRIPRLFGFAPLPNHGVREVALDVGFVAAIPFGQGKNLRAFPFACTAAAFWGDEGFSVCGPSLYFSSQGPAESTRRLICDNFGSLLLAAPRDLATWEDFRTTSNSRYVSHTGFDGRQFFTVESNPAEDSLVDNHSGFATGWWQRCPDCDGAGIEDVFPFLSDCGLCEGTGRISW
jgi:hypothetical protein